MASQNSPSTPAAAAYTAESLRDAALGAHLNAALKNNKDKELLKSRTADGFFPLEFLLKSLPVQAFTRSHDELATAIEGCRTLELSSDRSGVRHRPGPLTPDDRTRLRTAAEAVFAHVTPEGALCSAFLQKRSCDNVGGWVWLRHLAGAPQLAAFVPGGDEDLSTHFAFDKTLAEELKAVESLEVSAELLAVRRRPEAAGDDSSALAAPANVSPSDATALCLSIANLLDNSPYYSPRKFDNSGGFLWLEILATDRSVAGIVSKIVDAEGPRSATDKKRRTAAVLAHALGTSAAFALSADKLAVRRVLGQPVTMSPVGTITLPSEPVVVETIATDAPDPSLVRVCSFNVLSTAFSRDMVSAEPSSVDNKNRFELLQKVLMSEIKMRAVICLQELSLSWQGKLAYFFAKENYALVWTGYEGPRAHFMGVGIAYSREHYELISSQTERAANVLLRVGGSTGGGGAPPPTSLGGSILGALLRPFREGLRLRNKGPPKPPPSPQPPEADVPHPAVGEDPWPFALAKRNQVVSVRLIPFPKAGGPAGAPFCISTYHMPCVFWNDEFMRIHGALAAQAARDFARGDDYMLLGDFNSKPDSSLYQMITRGAAADGSSDFSAPPDTAPGSWRPEVEPLRSAVAEAHGAEPRFTSFSLKACDKERGAEPFKACIDYIFISGGWTVESAVSVPCDSIEAAGLMPNAAQPSDHALIHATLSRRPLADVENDP